MLSGSAVNPRISTSQIAELVVMAQMPKTPQTAAPLASHARTFRKRYR
jgi:membrane carboxypeptidase/penicillin-binding protein